MQHEIELDVSFNLIHSFPMIASCLRQCISIVTMAHVIINDIIIMHKSMALFSMVTMVFQYIFYGQKQAIQHQFYLN